MEFIFETEYNQRALTTMARGLRKTIRRKRNIRSRVIGFLTAVLGASVNFARAANGAVFDTRSVVTWLAILVLGIVFIWEDSINGYTARRRLMPGTEKASSIFHEDMFTSTTEVGRTEWNYDKILFVAETADYFVFIFSTNYAQVYDKSAILGGSLNEFRRFMERVTGKTIQKI